MVKDYKIMIVAGEASGDAHAAKLVRALKEAAPDTNFDFFGSAGVRMRDAGVEPVVRADELAIMGLPEIAKALPVFIRAFRLLKKAAVGRKADAVILVDFPEFNLKLAKSLKKQGLKVIYYISPQLWGWRSYRRRTIRDHVDLLLTILPFEKDWYAARGITNVKYVGSPLASEVRPSQSKEDFCEKHGLDPERGIIALLPGSRHKEITRILPLMLEAAALMAERDEQLQFVIALASVRSRVEVEHASTQAGQSGIRLPKILITVEDETYNALNAADAAAVASGTATLETGIIGTPMAIVYKTSNFNYRLLRPLIKVEHFGLINLIAGERIAREMIQDDFTPKRLADEMFRILKPDVNASMREKLGEAAEKLGHGGASKRSAEIIIRQLKRSETPT
ncbi:MAG: lipid-A-disaccharide synthase [Pyrinomonadaceae bacterium]